jgi:hypothetical protein
MREEKKEAREAGETRLSRRREEGVGGTCVEGTGSGWWDGFEGPTSREGRFKGLWTSARRREREGERKDHGGGREEGAGRRWRASDHDKNGQEEIFHAAATVRRSGDANGKAEE